MNSIGLHGCIPRGVSLTDYCRESASRGLAGQQNTYRLRNRPFKGLPVTLSLYIWSSSSSVSVRSSPSSRPEWCMSVAWPALQTRTYSPYMHSQQHPSMHYHKSTKLWFCDVQWHLVSVRTFGVMYGPTFFFACNHQSRHLATHKVGCQPGDYRWLWDIFLRVCVGMHG